MKKDTQQLLSSVNQAIIKIRGAYAAWTRENNVNYHEMLIFYSLRDKDNCTQKQICDSYMIPKQSVNNVICTLKKEGYLELTPDEKNRREKILKLTESGKKYAREIMGPLFELEEKAIQEMGKENIHVMTEMALCYGEILKKEMDHSRQRGENKR